MESRKLLNRKFTVGCGLEKHHILPKALGGSDSKDNIVILTPREHCVAHLLLAKMYVGEAKAKMCYALIALMRFRNKNRESITTRQYETLRKAHMAVLMDPDYRKMRSDNTKKQWTSERRASVSEKTKKQWKENTKKSDFYQSDEWKERQSKNTKSRWQDSDYKKERSEQAKKQWENGGSLRSRTSAK